MNNLFGKYRQFSKSFSTRKILPVRKGNVSAPLSVLGHIARPPYVITRQPQTMDMKRPFEIKPPEVIDNMRNTCRLGRKVMEFARTCVKVGITTDEIDKKVHEFIVKHDAYPSPLGYNGFPKSICSSINEVLCHGIPDDRVLQDGDIITIDISVWKDGVHADLAETFLVGNVDDRAKRLAAVTKECLNKAIKLTGPNVDLSKIGEAIEDHATANGFQVSKQFCGHGVGSIFHAPPLILHYRNTYPGKMLPGMTFTIEPIITEGSPASETWDDDWTEVSLDKSSWAAQYEQTVLITPNGHEVLTRRDDETF